MKDKSEYVVQAVSNALNLLELFNDEVHELSVVEIGRRLSLREPTVIRLLMTLESRGYIELDRLTGSYRLGLKSLELRQNFVRQMDFSRRSKTALRNLVTSCNETSYITIFKDNNVVYLDVIESDAPVRVVSRRGAHLPLHSTASGKVNLANMDAAGLARWREACTLDRYTDTTITADEPLSTELELIRTQGYAIDNEEMEIGVCCLAAPVRDYTGDLIGTVSISGPTTRFGQERIELELAPLVLQVSRQLSTCLGFHSEEEPG